LVVLVEPLLIVRRVLREQIGILHRRLLAIVRDDWGATATDPAVSRGPIRFLCCAISLRLSLLTVYFQ
jgi:hypothetical protein